MKYELSNIFIDEADAFVHGLDKAIDTHMDWTRRILRCAALGESPGDDVLLEQSHTACQFGKWLECERHYFDSIDAEISGRIAVAHRAMHDAMRALCKAILGGGRGRAVDLGTFESNQSELITLLSQVKTTVLTTAARSDPLTGLPMRYGLDRDFELCSKDASRRGESLYMVLIDIDRFKDINDTYGHPVGDLALKKVADALKSTIRQNESIYRFGGEEFLIFLRCKTPECPILASKRIHQVILDTPFCKGEDERFRLTVTQGIARVGRGESFENAIQRADQALYEGKRGGRNQSILSAYQGESHVRVI